MINEPLHVHQHLADCRCLAWKPIIAGALVAVGLSFLLNLFGVAIGLTAFTTNNDGAQTMAFGGMLGVAIGIIASMFAAGWVAGYLGNRYCSKGHIGALYGFLTWCLALVIAIFVAAHAQQYIDYYSHVLSGTPGNVSAATTNVGNNNVTVAAPNSVIISTYIMFALFFLGAVAASLGGHVGMRHYCHDDQCNLER